MTHNTFDLTREYKSSQIKFFQYYLLFPTQENIAKIEIQEELPNLQLAFIWAIERSEKKLLFKFWNGMKDFLFDSGYWNTFVKWGEKTLELLEEDNNITKAWLLADLGWLAMEQAEYPRALELFTESRKVFKSIFQPAPDPRDLEMGICAIERYLGVLFYRMKQYEKAEAYYEKALILSQEYKFPGMVGEIRNLQGSLARKLGKFSEAKMFYDEARNEFEKLGKHWHLPVILLNIARLHIQQGDFDSAKLELEKAINLCITVDRKDVLYGCQAALAEIEFELKNYENSLQLAIAAREGFAELGMLFGIERVQKLIDRMTKTTT